MLQPRTNNDNRILDAAAGVIARDGAGSASLNAVAKAAGLSHTAMSQRFDSSGELLAAVWEHRVVSQYLEPLVACAHLVIDSDGPSDDSVAAAILPFLTSSTDLRVATELLSAFPSNQVLRAIVQKSFAQVSRFADMSDRQRLVQHAFIMEILIGTAIVRRTMPADSPLLVGRLVRMLVDARTAHPEEPLPFTDASHLNSYPFDTGSEKLDRVLASCLWHVAEVGFDGMSTRQIAKTAGVSEGYIFSVFKAKAEIFIRATALQEEMGLEANRVYAQGTGAAFDEYVSNAIFLRDWQKPELTRQRAIMLEQRRASWHNAQMMANSAAALDQLTATVADERDVASGAGKITLLLNFALPIGAAVMAEMYPDIADYSHTVITPGLNLEG
ncbi:MAG: TetR/AcrR family transcriptional regulator [Actinobacteria bacterium]|nr:TetR/AcrR family transcriptional regulator [Actinomycetota bacterium]